MNVYRYICHNCHHWWSTSAPAEACPACRCPEPGRVYLESEEAAMLAALGALTFERDEALGLLQEALPGAMWSSCGYEDHEMANPLFHCCDWTEWCENVGRVLGYDINLDFEGVPGKRHHEFVKEVELERDEARRWAIYYRRKYEELEDRLAFRSPFTSDNE